MDLVLLECGEDCFLGTYLVVVNVAWLSGLDHFMIVPMFLLFNISK